MGNRLGLVSITFRNDSVDEIIEACCKSGISCIEWGSNCHVPCDDEENAKEVRKKCDEKNIKCCSYGSYYMIGKQSVEEIYDYIKTAKILGADIMRIWSGTKASKDFTEEDTKVFFETCKKLAKIAEEEGIILDVESHINYYTDSLETSLRLIKEVNSPNFRMHWQPLGYMTEEENEIYAKTMAPYSPVVHVGYYRNEVGRLSLHEGIDVWKRYLADFKDDIYLMLEFMPDGKIESLKNEADALRLITE